MSTAEQRTPDISVVVATYNRAETLRETLRCLDAQRLPPGSFEVIVVDDGSSDNTGAVVADAQTGRDFRLEYVVHPNQGPGFTQNRGIRMARAPLVLLIADDIFLAPDALAAHLAVHASHRSAEVAALGCVKQSPGLDQSVFISKWEPFRLGDLPDGQELPYHMFWACNVSFKREFMLEHGMFREQRGRGGAANHEDVELGYRLNQFNLRLIFSRSALGFHHHMETLGGTLRRAHERGLNWLDFRQRVPQPEIDVRYRVYTPLTLMADRAALTGPRRQYLLDSDRSLPRLSWRYVLRGVMFNSAAVHLLWLPLFRGAERSRLLARFVREGMYRGVVVHYFLKGVRNGRRRFGDLHRSPSAEGG